MEEYRKVYSSLNDYKFMMSRFVIGLMLLPCAGLALMPYQDGDIVIAFCVFNLMNLSLMLSDFKYLRVTEKGKTFSIFQKLKYLPVDPRVVARCSMLQMLYFAAKMTAVLQLVQLFSAIVFCHKIILMNFYPLFAGLFLAGIRIWDIYHQMRRML